MRTYETARRVMTTAHQIRRSAAEKFNCHISEIHWGECLRMAWAEVRKPSTLDVIRSFTNSWTKPGTGEERLYLDYKKTLNFIGMDVNFYNTGNVSSAFLNGERISNSDARRILISMEKVFYNVTTGKWDHRYTSDRAINLIMAKLEK